MTHGYHADSYLWITGDAVCLEIWLRSTYDFLARHTGHLRGRGLFRHSVPLGIGQRIGGVFPGESPIPPLCESAERNAQGAPLFVHHKTSLQ